MVISSAGLLTAAPAKPAVGIEIKMPPPSVGTVWAEIDITARAALRSMRVTAFLDKAPLTTPPLPPLSMVRGERRSLTVPIQIKDSKQHWLYVEAEVVLQSGEVIKAGKSLSINPGRKNQKPEAYETYRTEKPHK